MLGFIIGIFIGGIIGVFAMCVCAEQPQKPTNVWISQIQTNTFIGFGDSNSERIVVSLLVKRR